MSDRVSSLSRAVDDLIACVTSEAEAQMDIWGGGIERDAFRPSAYNLAAYLALRRRDLRPLQRPLTSLGLSSLGRLEGRVLPTLTAVRAALSALSGGPVYSPAADMTAIGAEFFLGETRLAANVRQIFGAPTTPGAVALLVTCPSEAGDHPDFMAKMIARKVEAVRINCAHDTPKAWGRMIRFLRDAETSPPQGVRVFMDLAGPKIRTGRILRLTKAKRAFVGDRLAVTAPGQLERSRSVSGARFGVECTLSDVLTASRAGDRLFIDDGRLEARIDRVEPWGVLAEAVGVEKKGLSIKPEKGLNFPDCPLKIAALTHKDRKDLAFVSAHADVIEYSFVQCAADVLELQQALAVLRPTDWRTQPLVLKIETARAVHNLPEIIVQAAGRQPTAIMIARGDLAVEIGFPRTAEIQEEILWLGEAADIPVIWATQVLENLISKGEATRSEMTDAAMAARAECVMLNKGPYLLEGIDQLRGLLSRMTDHQHKKTPQLRALKSWGDPVPPSA